MARKYTASHWGSYEIKGSGESRHLIPIEDDPCPAAIGTGWLDAMQNPGTRIARPAIRKGWLDARDTNRSGDAAFVEVPWDEALDLFATELGRVCHDHGNGAIYAGSYGWASAGRFHHAQSQMRRFLNTIGGFVGYRNTYSHAAAEVLLPYLVGEGKYAFQEGMTSWPSIVDRCELFVTFGGLSTKRTAQVDSAGTARHDPFDWVTQAISEGMKLVNISPRQSDSDHDAEWIAPRPGTDTALILALAHELIRTDKANRDFLTRCTHGADVFEAYVMGLTDGLPKTAEWAADICDIPRDTIAGLAARMASCRTMINMTWSMQRADHGEQTIWAGLALACVLGQIGQPGTGWGFGYGSTTPVGRPAKPVGWASMPQGVNPVDDFIPVARVTEMLEAPKSSYRYDGQERSYPDARLVWWSGGNPFHHHQDLMRLDAAWRRPETVVVTDHSWTATARRADIVLPATGPLERSDIMMNRRDPALVTMSPAMPPYEQARDDFEIMCGLAKRMGTLDAFTAGLDVEGWQAQIWEDSRATLREDGIVLPSFAEFRDEGRYEVDDARESFVKFATFVADPVGHPLKTPSGKIELYSERIKAAGLSDCPASPQWMEPIEWLGDAKPNQLHLISGQPMTRLHAQFDAGSASKASKIKDREACALHPDAAAARGLKAGDAVLIENQRGACLAGLELDAELRPDCLWLATGAWLDIQEIEGRKICVHGNPNVLTIDKGSSELGQGNIAHTALVEVSLWEKELPEIKVHSLPEFVEKSGS